MAVTNAREQGQVGDTKQAALEQAAQAIRDADARKRSISWPYPIEHDYGFGISVDARLLGALFAALDASPRPEVQAGYYAVCYCDDAVPEPNPECPVHGEHPAAVTTTNAPKVQEEAPPRRWMRARKMPDPPREVQEEAEARIAALEAGLSDAIEYMIWMTGGWGLDHKITDEALPLMHAGIDRARALLAGTPDAPRDEVV